MAVCCVMKKTAIFIGIESLRFTQLLVWCCIGKFKRIVVYLPNG